MNYRIVKESYSDKAIYWVEKKSFILGWNIESKNNYPILFDDYNSAYDYIITKQLEKSNSNLDYPIIITSILFIIILLLMFPIIKYNL